LAALLLFIKRTTSGTTGSSRSTSSDEGTTHSNPGDCISASSSSSMTIKYGFWLSYITLLQDMPPHTALCSGGWSDLDLQQLEPKTFRVSWQGRAGW
jgi:hypothetical protein